MTNKECSKCGTNFSCHADGNGCWCEQYQLSTESLAELKNNFADCLCPNCLNKYQTVSHDEESNTNKTVN